MIHILILLFLQDPCSQEMSSKHMHTVFYVSGTTHSLKQAPKTGKPVTVGIVKVSGGDIRTAQYFTGKGFSLDSSKADLVKESDSCKLKAKYFKFLSDEGQVRTVQSKAKKVVSKKKVIK